jgi:glycosyltransferase involved in cell wall biosynthesis
MSGTMSPATPTEAGATAQRVKTRTLRVGLVGPLPPPAGGMAGQCQQLRDLLTADGLELRFVQTNAPYRPRWIERVKGIRAVFRLLPYLVAVDRLCRSVDVVHLMANSGWAWHLFAAPVVWIARMRGTAVIVNYRGGEAERFLANAPRWVPATLRAADACIVPSGFLEDVMMRFGVPTAIIPNVVDLGRFRPPEVRAARHDKHVIVARNLEGIYAIDDALRAFERLVRRLSGVRLTVAGEGPERERLLALAQELGIAQKVTFAGRLSRDEMAQLYRSADVMLNPSTVDNMPNSLLEAYASGVPVVSTNVGGIPFIARNGETALLVPARDVEAMAACLHSVLTTLPNAENLVRNGLQEARRYVWEQVGPEWVRLYTRCSSARERS